MKVYISADMEGITGLVAWGQCGRPDSSHYDFSFARTRMAGDVNAAIRGARDAGATEIVVKDSHGNSKNLLIDMLEPGIQLISGHGGGSGGMMAGIDRECAAAVLVGYHAMAGTAYGIMEHTLTGYVHRMQVNGMPAGEICLSTAVAGCFDVPIVAITSDRAGCEEAKTLLPKIETAVVKQGMGRYMGKCLHPEESAALIRETVRKGVEAASSMDPWLPTVPTTVSIEFNRSEEADHAAKCVGARRTDAYTIEVTADSWAEVHQATWQVIAHAGMGAGANN